MLPLEFTFNHLSQNCCWLNSTSIVEFAHSQQNKCFMVLPTSQARTFKEFEQVAEARCFQILLTILWWKGPQFRHVSKTPKTFLRTGWNWKLSVQSLGIMIPTKNFGRVSQMFVIFRPYCIRTYLSIIVYSPPRIQLLTEKDALGQLGWLANPESLIFFSLLLLSCQVSGRYEETKHCAEWGGGEGVVASSQYTDTSDTSEIQTSILIPRRGSNKKKFHSTSCLRSWSKQNFECLQGTLGTSSPISLLKNNNKKCSCPHQY